MCQFRLYLFLSHGLGIQQMRDHILCQRILPRDFGLALKRTTSFFSLGKAMSISTWFAFLYYLHIGDHRSSLLKSNHDSRTGLARYHPRYPGIPLSITAGASPLTIMIAALIIYQFEAHYRALPPSCLCDFKSRPTWDRFVLS